MSYNTKLGRDLLQKNKPPLRLAQDKWPNMLPPNFEFDTSRNSAFCDYINDSVLSHLGQERLSQVFTGAIVVDKSYRAFPVVSDMSSIILLGSSLMVLGDVAADVGDGA
jgi:hypothetical protein